MKILVIDDEQTQRDILAEILTDAGYDVTAAMDGEEGLRRISQEECHLVLTDLKMPGIDGMTVLQEALGMNPDIQVVLMTAFGTIPGAVSAIKTGAYDYLTKPFRKEDLLRVVQRAAEKSKLLQENRQLKNEIFKRYGYHNLIGASKPMQELFRLIDRIKNIDATVLVTGESGTGKELVARAIHYNGSRQHGPFVAINCGAIPENLIESELFGHQKGAFTGAVRSYAGKFEQAQNGTIFLDEIGAMPLALQVRLMRVLQEKTVERVGGTDSIKLDVRVIAATNENLEGKIRENLFRNDLFHRLNVFAIHLPPLRERVEDIPLLARHFLRKAAEKYSRPTPQLSSAALERLEKYGYPGNVRELENIIEKSVILCDLQTLGPDALMMPQPRIPGSSDKFREQADLPAMELDMIVEALKDYNGSIKKASQKLGISYKTLQYRMRKFNIRKEDYKR